MARYMPPDWPERVQPPGTEGWEASAVAWLLDCDGHGLLPGLRLGVEECLGGPQGVKLV
jgi:hypothetical protein